MVVFIAIIMCAHLALRRWAPYADPLLLPLGALLNGLGIVMIYRLHEVGRSGNPGPVNDSGVTIPILSLSSSAVILQIVYTVIGIGCFVAFLVFIKEPRILQRYTYIFGLVGVFLIALPAFLPTSISGVAGTGAKIQIAIPGLGSIQPEEFAKLALAASFAGYLVAKRDVLSLAGRRVLGVDLPRGRDLGPIAVVWLVALLLLVSESDIGTSAVLHGPVRRDDLHRDVADLLAADRFRRLRRRGLHRRGTLLARGPAVQRLAAPVQRREPSHQPAPRYPAARVPDGAGPVRNGERRTARQVAWAMASHGGRRWCRATSSSPRSARSSGWPGRWHCCSSTA